MVGERLARPAAAGRSIVPSGGVRARGAARGCVMPASVESTMAARRAMREPGARVRD
jgi:hypothetical protein